MKFFLILLFFPIFTLHAQEQNVSSTLHITEVEVPPVFPGCEKEEEFKSCSSLRIATLFMETIDPLLLFNLRPDERYLNLRFIVDHSGKVVKPMVQTKNEEIEAVATKVIQNLPIFHPGVHKGQSVNVIIDIPLQLTPASQYGSNTGAGNSQSDSIAISPTPGETPPIAKSCNEAIDLKKCTSTFVQQFLFKRFDLSNINTKQQWIETVIHFTIDQEGKVTNLIPEGNNKKLNKESIRVLKSLPNFIPATKDGINVSVTYSVPIRIKSSK